MHSPTRLSPRPPLSPAANTTPSPPPSPPRPHAHIFSALLSDLRRSARRLTRDASDADDLVQDTLLRVWSRMATGPQADGPPEPPDIAAASAGPAGPIEDLRAYAFATLRHRAFARGALVRPVPDTPEPAELAAPRGSDAATRLGCAEALAALATLPDEQQALLRLRAVDGLSYAEIARRTGLPLGTVTSRLARGRSALREALDLPPGAPVTDLLGGG